jgi:predicted 3-demethylubiquinone-9 3-methyltransferase (glyoxalase superfamily)
MTMTKVATCLWYDGTAEEAARLYTSLIPDSTITKVHRAVADNPSGRKGDVITVDFTIGGHDIIALNGGPEFKHTEAASLSVLCEDQAEVDRLWSSLILGGGEPSVCGWLKDKFGVSWQIIPKILPELLDGPDRDGAERTFKAMLGMTKLDVEQLRGAYEGVPV